MEALIDRLLDSQEPSVRYKVRGHVLGEDPESETIQIRPDGGWPAEERFYRISDRPGSGRELVSWGGVDKQRMNEWVTIDALTVLRAAGRLDEIGGG